MDGKRLLKQLIYGGFFLIIIAGVVLIFYFKFKPQASCFDKRQNQGEEEVDCGGPCESCEIRRLKPIAINASPRIFDLNTPVLFFGVFNPNPNYAAKKLPYTLKIYDSSNQLIGTREEETFIYSGEEEKYILKPIDLARAFFAEINLGAPAWKAKTEFEKPKIDFRSLSKERVNDKYSITGLLVNNEAAVFGGVMVGALFYDSAGGLVSASRTEVNDIKAFEQRFFQLEHPFVDRIDFDKTRLFFEALRP